MYLGYYKGTLRSFYNTRMITIGKQIEDAIGQLAIDLLSGVAELSQAS